MSNSKPVRVNWEALTWTRVIMMAVLFLLASLGGIWAFAYLAGVTP